MRERRPSCRKSGANAPESTIRGSLEARTRDLEPFDSTAHSKSPGRENPPADSNTAKPSPPAPYRRFGRFRTEKRQHAAEEPKRGCRNQESIRRKPDCTHQTPDTQTLGDTCRQESNQIAAPWISCESRKRKETLSKQSCEASPCRRTAFGLL